MIYLRYFFTMSTIEKSTVIIPHLYTLGPEYIHLKIYLIVSIYIYIFMKTYTNGNIYIFFILNIHLQSLVL